jgi:hypothetical protein
MMAILQRRYSQETASMLFNFFTRSHPHDTPLTIYVLPKELGIELFEPEAAMAKCSSKHCKIRQRQK